MEGTEYTCFSLVSGANTFLNIIESVLGLYEFTIFGKSLGLSSWLSN
jgi:hypothetical protein